MLAFVMIWAYVLLPVFAHWGANITEEVPWYLAHGGLEIHCHRDPAALALPFVLLIFRDVKRNC